MTEESVSELELQAVKSFSLKLFCSVDMTGSTAFKYRHQPWEGASKWPEVIESFIEDLPLEVRKASAAEGISETAQLQVWKMLGDEVLFQTTLREATDVLKHLSAVKSAMASYSPTLKANDYSLGLKGTAWVAGFPVTNREVEIGENVDYVGPAIDLGFRLAGKSSERKFVVDCGIAMMLIAALDIQTTREMASHQLFFDGCELLKGVGAPYPILWMNMGESRSEIEDKLRRQEREPADWLDLRDYLLDYYERAKTIKHPFMVDENGKATFGDVDKEILDARVRELSEPSEKSWENQPPGDDDSGEFAATLDGDRIVAATLDELRRALNDRVSDAIQSAMVETTQETTSDDSEFEDTELSDSDPENTGS